MRSLWLVAAITACSTTPTDAPLAQASAEAPQARPGPASTVSAMRSAPPTASTGKPAEPCAQLGPVSRLEVKAGAEAKDGELGLGVSFHGVEHDSFEGGRTDQAANLSFHGIMDDGSLTPSAMTWRPSILAAPRWAPFAAMGFCARLVSVRGDVAVVELARAPQLKRSGKKR